MLSKIDLAKVKIAMYCSFMISLTSKLRFEVDNTISTVATDGRKVYYNQEYVDSLTLAQVIGLIIHEVMHNMFGHPSCIQKVKYPGKANVAMDIRGNKTILKFFVEFPQLKGELPPTDLVGPKWDKYDDAWNWERIYDDLPNPPEGGGGGGYPGQFDKVMPPCKEDGTPMKPDEVEALAKEWAMAAQQAATVAKQRGTMPGMFEDLITEMVTPKIDWISQVWDVFTRVAKDEQSWQRFNRRYIHSGLYLPGMYSERIGLVGFFVDTSGSMNTEEFKLALGAINEIMEDLKPERIVFGQCDTRMTSVQELTPDDLPMTAMGVKGRGGTVLTPIFEYIQQMDEEPELVVVLTDGGFSAIDARLQPKCPTTWVVTSSYTKAAEQSFGRVIEVVL